MRLIGSVRLAALCALTGGTVLSALPATAAGPPQGRKCSFSSATDVTREPGWQTGNINGGPLVSPDGTDGTIICTVQLNAGTHNGPDAYAIAGSTGVATVVPPTVFGYNATSADEVTLCTEYVDNWGTSWYWTSSLAGLGAWSLDSSASCGTATSLAPDSEVCPVLLALDSRLGTTLAETWQDCEPYEPIGGDVVPGPPDAEVVAEPGRAGANDGSAGALLQFSAEASDGPGDGHDVASSCTFRVHRPTGTITVIGKTKAARHPRASASYVRCRLEDRVTGAVVFDESRIAADDTVVLDAVFFVPANDLRVCNTGNASWPDGHSRAVPFSCL